MAEKAKPPGNYKELFTQKSESGKEERKKRRKRQKQRANVDENQQHLSRPQEYSAMTQDESSAKNKQYSDETLLKNILEATTEDQQILNAKMGAETTERSNQRDRNVDEDFNEIKEELSFESSAQGKKDEEEDPNTLNRSSLARQQSESAERSTLHQLENNKTGKFSGPLSKRRSKKGSKAKLSSFQDKQEPKRIEGSKIPVADKNLGKGSDKETSEELAIKEEVKLEFSGATTVQKYDMTSMKSLEGVPKKMLDKGHKGKTLKQLASFGRNKKKAGITASYSRTSLEDENLDIEPQKPTNEETIRSYTAANPKQGIFPQQPSSSLQENLLQEPVSGKSYTGKQGIIDTDQTQEENQDKGKKKGTKAGLKKSKSYARILRKKSLKDEDNQSSEKQKEKISKSNDGGGDKPLESSGTGHEILHEQNIDGADLESRVIQSNREIAEPQTDNISQLQDDEGDEGIEGVEIKQTTSKKERKESLLIRQIKKLRSPSKGEEDKEKNGEEAHHEGEERGENEEDNGLDKNDTLSADNEITKPVKRKKSGLRKSLSRALKRKKRVSEDAQDEHELAGEQEDPNEAERTNKSTSEGTEMIPEIQEEINSSNTSLEVLAAKQTQVESEEMEKFSKEGKTPSDSDNQDRSVKLHELKAKENKEECIPNKETIDDNFCSKEDKEIDSHSAGDQSKAIKNEEQEETSLESAKSEDTNRTEDEIISEAHEMCQKLMKIVIDELIVYIAKKEALTAQNENESQVEELAIDEQNRRSSKTEDEDNSAKEEENTTGQKDTSLEIYEGTKAVKRKRNEMKESQDLKKRRADSDDVQQDEENPEDKFETQDYKPPEGFAREEDGSEKTNKLSDEEITDNRSEVGQIQVNKELATKNRDDDFEETKSGTNEETVDLLTENQEKSGGVKMTESRENIVFKEEKENASWDNIPENNQVTQQKNSSGDQNDGRYDEEEEESSWQSEQSEDELVTEENMINEARQANKQLMKVVIDELTEFIEDKKSSSAEEDQLEVERPDEEHENAPKCGERKADADTDDEEVRAVGERRSTATGPRQVHNGDLPIENPDTMLVDTKLKADVCALERKNDEENRKVTEDVVNSSSYGSEGGAKETMPKQGVTDEKGAGKIKERSYDRSSSVEKSLTATPRSPKEEWIVVDQLDISLEISRQLKHVLGFEERTASCCTVM